MAFLPFSFEYDFGSLVQIGVPIEGVFKNNITEVSTLGSFFVKISGKLVYNLGVDFALSLSKFSGKKTKGMNEWLTCIQLTKARLPPLVKRKKKGKKLLKNLGR